MKYNSALKVNERRTPEVGDVLTLRIDVTAEGIIYRAGERGLVVALTSRGPEMKTVTGDRFIVNGAQSYISRRRGE